MTQYGVVLFHTTSAVMRAEKLLMKDGYSIKLIPTPRQFSSDCGIALRFDWDFCEHVRLSLDAVKVEFDSVHFLDTKPV
jgi:hypothetical protein